MSAENVNEQEWLREFAEVGRKRLASGESGINLLEFDGTVCKVGSVQEWEDGQKSIPRQRRS